MPACRRCWHTWGATMGARQKEWARRARIRLTAALGGHCAACGERNNLTFDCLQATGSNHHSWDSSQRMSFYNKQARAGNLGLLCGYCNSMKAGLNPSEWSAVLQWLASSRHIHRLSQTPGQGNALSAADLRECLRVAVSKQYAIREATAQIKATFSVAPQPVVVR